MLRADEFLTVKSVLSPRERVCLRNLALSFRVHPEVTTPVFACIGSTQGGPEISFRCGCPQATILSMSKSRYYTSNEPCVGLVGMTARDAHNYLYTGTHILFFGATPDDPIGQGTLAALAENVFPGGYIVVLELSGKASSATQYLQNRLHYKQKKNEGRLWIFQREDIPRAWDTPAVTFITRTYNRPRQLALNIASIKAQTLKAYQHIIIPDDVGVGLHEANRSLAHAKDQVLGEYVMILDDDDYILTTGFVAEARHIRTFKHNPGVIVFKVSRLTEIVPLPEAWGLEEHDYGGGHRVCNCYLVRQDLFKDTIHAFGTPLAGDQNWQKELFRRKPTFFWWDCIASVNTRIGRCEPEEYPFIWRPN